MAASPASPAPAADQVKLALERTFLAQERTLMAWIRTSASLITFGFALYKFFYYIHQDRLATRAEEVFGARTYGLIIMALGAVFLALATLLHRQQNRALRRLYPEAPASLSWALALLVGALGVLAFAAALFRL